MVAIMAARTVRIKLETVQNKLLIVLEKTHLTNEINYNGDYKGDNYW